MSETQSSAVLAQLLAKIEQLEATVTHQQSRLNQLEATALRPLSQPPPPDTRSTRRKLLKRVAGIAAGAAVVSTVFTPTKNASAGYLGDLMGSAPANIGLYAYPPVTGVSGLPTGNIGLVGSNTGDFGNPGSLTCGIYGYSPTTTAIFGNGVTGVAGVGTAAGVSGTSIDSPGVYGTSGSGAGVYGNSGNAVGVQGNSNFSYGGLFDGGKAPLYLMPSNKSGAPNSSSHKYGELYVSTESGGSGNLYFCTQGDGSGLSSWINLSGTGGLQLLPLPVRVAATIGTAAPLNNAKLVSTGNVPSFGDSSTVQLQITGGSTGIPVGAKAVVGVLTNVGATAGGNLRFWTGGNAPQTSNLNVPGALPSLNLTASFAIPLDSNGRTLLGFATGAIGAQCGYVVDISGYLV